MQKLSFSKPVFKPEECKISGLSFSCGQKYFYSGAFLKLLYQDNHIFPPLCKLGKLIVRFAGHGCVCKRKLGLSKISLGSLSMDQ